MGAVFGCCRKLEERADENGSQYESLVTLKPPPVTLDSLEAEMGEKMVGVPLFAPAKSDGEDAVSDPATLTDTELNLYASKLEGEEESE